MHPERIGIGRIETKQKVVYWVTKENQKIEENHPRNEGKATGKEGKAPRNELELTELTQNKKLCIGNQEMQFLVHWNLIPQAGAARYIRSELELTELT